MKQITQIRSVSRAISLLFEVADRPHGATASAAATACELAVPTAHHLLSTLAQEGLLARDGTRFVLGPRASVLADRVARQTDVPNYLMSALRWLSRASGETSYLAAWRHEEIRLLHWIEGVGALRVAEVERGRYRMPHARATGKVLLAFAPRELRDQHLAAHLLEPVTPNTITDPDQFEAELERVREQGWSEDHEEFLEGVACVSAPVIVHGALIAALTVSSPAGRFASRRDELREAVRRAARLVAEPESAEDEQPSLRQVTGG